MSKRKNSASKKAAPQDPSPATVPGDGIEDILAVQMTATYEAAMDCLRRSAADGQSPELRDMELKHAERLLAIYTRQVDVLGRHRVRQEQLKERLDREHQEGAPEPMILTHYFVAPDGTRTLGRVTVIVKAPDGTSIVTEKVFPEEPEAAENDAAEAQAAAENGAPDQAAGLR